MPSARVMLLVLYSDRMEECRTFYSALGLVFDHEQHGRGPQHYAAVLHDGTVFEIYPATAAYRTGTLRLGFHIDGAAVNPPLGPGRHLLTDPDGRTVEVHTS